MAPIYGLTSWKQPKLVPPVIWFRKLRGRKLLMFEKFWIWFSEKDTCSIRIYCPKFSQSQLFSQRDFLNIILYLRSSDIRTILFAFRSFWTLQRGHHEKFGTSVFKKLCTGRNGISKFFVAWVDENFWYVQRGYQNFRLTGPKTRGPFANLQYLALIMKVFPAFREIYVLCTKVRSIRRQAKRTAFYEKNQCNSRALLHYSKSAE